MKKSVVLIFVLVVTLSSVHAQNRNREVSAIKEVVSKWNSDHHIASIDELSALYADSVFYYGKSLGKESCIKGKSFWLGHYYDFNQEITSPIKVTFYKSGTIKCSFTKRTTYEQTVEEFEAYLLLQKSGDSYLITGEGDTTTDNRAATVLNLGEEEPVADTIAVKPAVVAVAEPIKEKENFLSSKWIVIPAVILAATAVFFIWLFKKNKTESEEPVYEKSEVPEFTFGSDDDVEVVERKSKRKRKSEKNREEEKPADDSKVEEDFSSTYEPITETKPVVDASPVQNALDQEENHSALQFEQYVISKFDREVFKVISWQRSNSWLPKSGRNPDMEFKVELKSKTVFFAVECKWRQEFYNGQIDLAKQDELEHYRKYQFQKDIKVFIVLGVGGDPIYPETVYIIPLDKISSTILQEDSLQRYRRFRNNNFFLDTTMMQLR